ncbi:MAG TPA: nickel-binding protein [Gaiellaceae bacterium]|jgi:hypothetical protein|nr:nickel-binding protein [Gaiellaceae bacterium]
MTMFMIERTFHVAEDQMDYVGRRSNLVTRDQYPEITWHHSHVVIDDDGKVRTYCVYEAPNKEIVEGHAAALGMHTVDGIYEIAGDVTPDDFPLT